MGDKTISWDPENTEDTDRAFIDIEAMKAAGYTIVEQGDDGLVVATMNPDVSAGEAPEPDPIDPMPKGVVFKEETPEEIAQEYEDEMPKGGVE